MANARLPFWILHERVPLELSVCVRCMADCWFGWWGPPGRNLSNKPLFWKLAPGGGVLVSLSPCRSTRNQQLSPTQCHGCPFYIPPLSLLSTSLHFISAAGLTNLSSLLSCLILHWITALLLGSLKKRFGTLVVNSLSLYLFFGPCMHIAARLVLLLPLIFTLPTTSPKFLSLKSKLFSRSDALMMI